MRDAENVVKQSAYEVGHTDEGGDVDDDIQEAMYLYLARDLGIAEPVARERAASELERTGPKAILDELARLGADVAGKEVLDVGAGLGGLSEEMVVRGATVHAIEPGAAWASVAERRAGRHGVPYDLRRSRGEELPFADASMDMVVSLQVLEHVQSPEEVLSEVWRVLKPGGWFYLACENYLAFKEAHYRVAWLPLLPKRIGAAYLRRRGRSPQFLMEAVTYVTFPQVMRWTSNLGFERVNDRLLIERIDRLPGRVGRVMQAAAGWSSGRWARLGDRTLRSFRFGIWEPFRKPLPVSSD